MRIDRYLKPTTTLVAGMAILAIAEMVAPKIASTIVNVGARVKSIVGVK